MAAFYSRGNPSPRVIVLPVTRSLGIKLGELWDREELVTAKRLKEMQDGRGELVHLRRLYLVRHESNEPELNQNENEIIE